MVRTFSLALAVLALGLIMTLPTVSAAAEEETHEGILVSAGADTLTMTDKDGKNQQTHTVAVDAKITCDGKECKLEDLKKGITLKVTTKKGDKPVAVRIEGSTK